MYSEVRSAVDSHSCGLELARRIWLRLLILPLITDNSPGMSPVREPRLRSMANTHIPQANRQVMCMRHIESVIATCTVYRYRSLLLLLVMVAVLALLLLLLRHLVLLLEAV